MTDTMWTLLWHGWVGAAVLMQVLWLIHLRTRNAGIVDVGWAAALGLLGIYYGLAGEAGVLRRLIVGGSAGIWGLRLAGHLLFDRVLGHPEEGRYVALRKRWGRHADRNLWFFFQAQALLAVILSLPFLFGAVPPGTGVGWSVIAGVALWITGLVGESIADRQLKRFKATPGAKGQVCREGLWRYSRHPNYFFEWVIWCGFGLMGLTGLTGLTGLAGVAGPSPYWGLLSLTGPALILFFLLRVTGIPPTEAQALRSRGDAYRRYQETTSAFVPWFPKRQRS